MFVGAVVAGGIADTEEQLRKTSRGRVLRAGRHERESNVFASPPAEFPSDELREEDQEDDEENQFEDDELGLGETMTEGREPVGGKIVRIGRHHKSPSPGRDLRVFCGVIESRRYDHSGSVAALLSQSGN
jgi:hypothetical protein